MAQTTSGKTAAEIIAEVRYDVNDSVAPYFASDTEMLQWLNEGRFNVCMDGNALQTAENIDLIADTVEYTPSNEYMKIVAVHYVNASSQTKALKPGSLSQVGMVIDNDEPDYWYDFDGKVGIFPSISSVTTEKVRVFEIPAIDDLSLTDSIDTPEIFDSALRKYIAKKFYWKDAKYATSANAGGNFDGEVAKSRIELDMTNE